MKIHARGPFFPLAGGLLGLMVIAACQPTVKIEAPDKPIEINVNVRVKIEREAEKVIEQKDELF